MDPAAACNRCQYWQPENRNRDVATAGECRRRAPAPNLTSARDIVGLELKGVRAAPMWATTRFDDWCGEFTGCAALAGAPSTPDNA